LDFDVDLGKERKGMEGTHHGPFLFLLLLSFPKRKVNYEMRFFSHHKDTKIRKGSKFLPFTFVNDTLNNKMNLSKNTR
jgi:hypothetical protein